MKEKISVLLSSFLLPLIMTAQTDDSRIYWSADRSLWADVNGDGIMESLQQMRLSKTTMPEIPAQAVLVDRGTASGSEDGYKLCYLPFESGKEYVNADALANIRVEGDAFYFLIAPERFEGMSDEEFREFCVNEYGIAPTTFPGSEGKYIRISDSNHEMLRLNGESSMGDGGCAVVFYNNALYVDVTSKFTAPSAGTVRTSEGVYFVDLKGKPVATVYDVELIDNGFYGWSYPEGYNEYSFSYLNYFLKDIDGDGIVEIFVDEKAYSSDIKPIALLKKNEDNVYREVQKFSQRNYYSDNFVETDINLDGRPDYYFLGNDGKHHVLVQRPDHSFVDTELAVTADSELVGDAEFGVSGSYVHKFTKPKINMSGFSMPGGDSHHVSKFDNISLSVDVNFDGYPDLIDTQKGGAFLSLGDGCTYYAAELGGQIELGDFNGDGLQDLVIFDSESGQVSVRLSSSEGYSEKNLVKNNALSKMFVHDFDKDGDLDILLAMNSTATGYSFLIFYSNDGKGSFKKIENSYQAAYSFNECIDMEGDGSFSIIASDNENSGVILFNVPSAMKPQPKVLLSERFSDFIAIDYDNDGRTELLYRTYDGASRYHNVEYSPSANTVPVSDAMPSVLVDGDKGFIRVEWKSAADRETSSADITYEVGVGTAKGDYSYARINAGRENSALIRTVGWAPGEYYVAVRAVDGAGMTGTYSASTTYSHIAAQPDFVIGSSLGTVGKEIDVTLLSPYNPEFTYSYDGGEGSVVKMGENGDCTITFASHGEKTIKLTVVDGRNVTTASRDIKVYASSTLANADPDNRLSAYADLDGDGMAERLNVMLEVNDGNGNFTPVGKMFNTENLWLHGSQVIDWNLDGMPDILMNGNMLVNEGDIDFSKETPSVTVIGSDNSTASYDGMQWNGWLMDFDNDGRVDVLGSIGSSESGVYRNLGNNTFKYNPIPDIYMASSAVYDFNNDGLLDILSIGDGRNSPFIALNRGNFEWDIKPVNSDIKVGIAYTGLDFGGVVDVNNDGFVDILIKENMQGYTDIFWGDKDMTYAKSTRVDNAVLATTGIDIDNDGYVDLIDTETRHLYYWMSDDTFWIEEYSQDNLHPYESRKFSGSDWRSDFECLYVDVNGDGTPDPKGLIRPAMKNDRPTAPAAVTAVASGKGVLLSWNASTDTETPAHQLRYNISLKKKDAEGADSYIISPMNCGKETAAILPLVTGSMPRSATGIIVPIDRFDATSEYELKVQAIDLWNATSPFSETHTFSVGSIVDIESPAVTGQGVATDFRYVGTEMTEQTWEWDGGKATLDAGMYKVVWDTPGVKTVACTVAGRRAETSILVKERPDLDFVLPEKVLGGAPVIVSLPEIFANASNGAELTASEGVEITLIPGELQASVVFPSEAGRYFVGVDYSDEIFGSIGSQNMTEVIQFTPEIAIVAVDGVTGKNRIEWNAYQVPAETGLFTKMRIYKETGRTDNFELIGEAEIADGNFIDMQSNPAVRKNRYVLALGTTYGGETGRGKVHGSTHLMINRGLGNSLNLMWNPYEGGVVDQYVILRGPSPENLEVLETLGGYENSFTDMAVPAVECYYALSYVSLVPQGRAGRAGADAPHSNVVCSRDASEVTFVESLDIKSVEPVMQLDENSQRLHLYARITPLRATFGEVQWRVVEGGAYAVVSSDGTVSLTGNSFTGTVKVEAKAKDGSNVAATVDIPVNYTSGISDVTVTPDELSILYDASVRSLKVTGVSRAVVVNIYTVSGALVKSETISNDAFLRLDFAPGVYIVNVEGRSKKIIVK